MESEEKGSGDDHNVADSVAKEVSLPAAQSKCANTGEAPPPAQAILVANEADSRGEPEESKKLRIRKTSKARGAPPAEEQRRRSSKCLSKSFMNKNIF